MEGSTPSQASKDIVNKYVMRGFKVIATNHGPNAKVPKGSGGQTLPTTNDAHEVEYNVQEWDTPMKTENGRAPFLESTGDWTNGFTVPIPRGNSLTHTTGC